MTMRPIPVLLYHRIDTSGVPGSTPPAMFERHLAWLADRGYRTLTLEAFEHALRTASVPARSLLITFDDGSADLASVAAPILRLYGFGAVAFVITGWISGERGFHGESLRWNDARQLAAEGRIEFQSHSHSHALWPVNATAGQEIAADLGASIDTLCAEMRVPRAEIRHLAWPWGRCDTRWETTAKRVGLKYQYLVQRGAVTRPGRSLRLPRLCFDGADCGSLARWMTLLDSTIGARVTNQIFGAVRERRHSFGYR